MKRGAVAIFDALGFKGIWKRHPEEAVRRKLHDLRNQALALVGGFNKSKDALKLDTPQLNIILLSDTIVISSTIINTENKEDEARNDYMSLVLAAYASSVIIALGAKYAPALAYRGCVTVGELEVDPPFMIGPAVDEAAAGERSAEAALVWFSPSAEATIQRAMAAMGSEFGSSPMWLPWSVPMKGGGHYQTHAITPYCSLSISEQEYEITYSPAEIAVLRDHILSTFDESRLDVAIKRQNTHRFLEEAARAQQP